MSARRYFQRAEAIASGKQSASKSSAIETNVDAPGEAPRSAASELFFAEMISVSNSSFNRHRRRADLGLALDFRAVLLDAVAVVADEPLPADREASVAGALLDLPVVEQVDCTTYSFIHFRADAGHRRARSSPAY